MELSLSHNSCMNTTLVDSDGKAVYTTKSPFRLGGRITTIGRVTGNAQFSSIGKDDNMSTYFEGPDGERLISSEIASIKWNLFATSKLTYEGKEMDVSDFLQPKGLMRRHRVFTGPDGKSYRWTLGSRTCTLETNDEERTPIARTHRSSLGIIGKSHPASLEITPAGLHMVDTIVISFIYCEQRRRERERAAESQ